MVDFLLYGRFLSIITITKPIIAIAIIIAIVATSLCTFLRDLQHLDIQSIRFHFERGDFQKWLRTTIGDDELARRIGNLDKTVSDEPIRQQLSETVQKRISELQLTET